MAEPRICPPPEGISPDFSPDLRCSPGPFLAGNPGPDNRAAARPHRSRHALPPPARQTGKLREAWAARDLPIAPA